MLQEKYYFTLHHGGRFHFTEGRIKHICIGGLYAVFQKQPTCHSRQVARSIAGPKIVDYSWHVRLSYVVRTTCYVVRTT